MPIRSWTTALVIWAAVAHPRASSARGSLSLVAHHQLEQQEEQEEQQLLRKLLRQQQGPQQHGYPTPPSLLIKFTTPTNGSRVEGPDVHIHYQIYNTREAGHRPLTSAEVEDLAETTTICFNLVDFDSPEICSPLRTSVIAIKDALPATWHTVTGAIKDTKTGRKLGGSIDGVSVFNNLNGFGVLEMCGKSACLDSTELRAAYFDHVYRHPRWNGQALTKGNELSKFASSLSIRSGLADVLSVFNIKSMLDAPCGDLTWIPLVPGIENVDYTGADIVGLAVEHNRRRFGPGQEAAGFEGIEAVELGEQAASAVRKGGGLKDPIFVQADLVEGVPTSRDGSPFDLVFVRDLMAHLPARHNLKVIHNIQASGARLLMAFTFVSANENHVSESFLPPVGHNINLSLPPYCLPDPIAVFRDESTDRDDLRMGVWDLHEHSHLALGGDCSPMAAMA